MEDMSQGGDQDELFRFDVSSTGPTQMADKAWP
jgi:hypothetical protein